MSVFPSNRQEMIRALMHVMGPTRVEPGCVSCVLMEEIENPGWLRYVEEWETLQRLNDRLRSRGFAQLLELLEQSLARPLIRVDAIESSYGLEGIEKIRQAAADTDSAALDQQISGLQ